MVRMHNFFKVSYRAMLKRLIQLKLCSAKKYPDLIQIATLENKDKLQALTREEGYSLDLIVPSKETYIPKEYLIYVKSNYERGKISYEKLKETLDFIDLSPEDLGYPKD